MQPYGSYGLGIQTGELILDPHGVMPNSHADTLNNF
jgi:hypothetical protein